MSYSQSGITTLGEKLESNNLTAVLDPGCTFLRYTVYLGPQMVSPPTHHLFGLEAFARSFPPGVDEKKKIPPGLVVFPPGGTISEKKRPSPRGKTPRNTVVWCCSSTNLAQAQGVAGGNSRLYSYQRLA